MQFSYLPLDDAYHSAIDPDAAPQGISAGDTAAVTGATEGFHFVTLPRASTPNYAAQLGLSDTGAGLHFRIRQNGAWNMWGQAWVSGSYPFKLAASGPTNPFSINIGSFPSGAQFPGSQLEAISALVRVPTWYTGHPYPVTGISSYVLSGNSASGNSHAALFGVALSEADMANPYAINTVTTNGAVIDPPTNGGHDFEVAIGAELDFNIKKLSTGASPTGLLIGISLQGGSEVATSGYCAAMQVFGLNKTDVPWTRGLHFRAGATGPSGAIQIDPTAWTGTNLYSQPIIFHSGTITDGNSDSPPPGTLYGSYIRGTPNGTLELVSETGAVTVSSIEASKFGIQMPEVLASSVPNAAPGTQRLFFDSLDHKLKRKDSAGVIAIIG